MTVIPMVFAAAFRGLSSSRQGTTPAISRKENIMKYADMTWWGTMEAVVNKLGGMEAVQRFLSSELEVKAVERVSRIFKTITLGQHKDYKSYCKALLLEADGYRIGDCAGQILKKIEVSQTPIELDLVVMTVGELGFPDGARGDAIYDHGKQLGVELCPAEVGPALRLVYKDQPHGEWLRIAMEPITDSDGDPRVFGVGNGNGVRWLDSGYGRPDRVWDTINRWVFVAPRKS